MMFLGMLYNKRILIAGAILLSVLLAHAPKEALAQDIAAVCEGSTALEARADPLNPVQDANAVSILLEPIKEVSLGGGGGSSILSSNVIPIVGIVLTTIFVTYKLISWYLNNRTPLEGPGALTVGPQGYAMVGFGFGSDDKECMTNVYEGELQPGGAIKYNPTGLGQLGAQHARMCNSGDLPDRKDYEVFVPRDKYAVGWRFTPSRTSGGRGYDIDDMDDGSPTLPCYFQIFRKVDKASGTLIGPLLGWSGRGLDNLSPADYNGTCDERDYRGGMDLKTVRLVSDLPDPNKNARSESNRCKASGSNSGWYNECQYSAPVVDITDPNLPPSRRIIYGIKFSIDDDAGIDGLCLAYNVTGRIIVRSVKAEAPDTELGLPFILQGPSPYERKESTAGAPGTATTTPALAFDDDKMELGSYTLSVPPGTESLFANYTCKLRLIDQSFDMGQDTIAQGFAPGIVNQSFAQGGGYYPTYSPGGTYDPNFTPGGTTDPNSSAGTPGLVDITDEKPCTELLNGTLDAVRPTEFLIEFTKIPCIPKTCSTVASGGAQCGAWSNGCDACIPGDPNPDNQTGCLDCGTCSGEGEVCTAEGRCVSILDASCRMSPSLISEDGTADFSINVSNGTEPYSCAWHSDSPLIDGKSTCAFNQTFPDPGIYNATVDVTDSSSPQKANTASCTLTVEDIVGPTAPPVSGVPDYSLCEVYKVLVRYGIPSFAILIVLAGFSLFLSLGNPARVQKGKQALGAGVLGLLVLLLAKPVFVSMMTFLGFQVYVCGQLVP
ncbi:MAG: hypothetical protein Q7S09_04645 [bacterium]|nr:hypothetical protein [bacterium]